MAIAPTISVVIRLGTAQTLAWASSYYLAAMLAAPMAREFDLPISRVFAAFSAALVISALFGPYAGRLIDRYGGRPVLAGSSLLFALGLGCLGLAQSPVVLLIAWLIIGLGMACGLYEAGFSALVSLYGRQSRGAITGITLIAGFASTVGWPLSAFMEVHFGWRAACLVWAGMHLTVGLALNLSLPRLTRRPAPEVAPRVDEQTTPAPGRSSWPLYALAYVFAATWFISTAMAAHLPGLLMSGGASLATAVMVGSLLGPAQVAARLLEFSVQRKVHPLTSARVAATLHPIGALAFGVIGAPAAAAFGLLHGAGNGILTIAKGTLPLVIFGPQGYGHRQGVLMVPARIAQAFAPWAFGLCLDSFGVQSLWLSSALGITAMLVLLTLSTTPAAMGEPETDDGGGRAALAAVSHDAQSFQHNQRDQ